MGMESIRHVVVVMMENRSFDNLLGWAYDETHRPVHNLPEQSPTAFEGLRAGAHFNHRSGPGSEKIFVTRPPKAWPPECPHPNQVPTPDPHEEFDFVTRQLFGDDEPRTGVPPSMGGFLANYATTSAGQAAAGQIMETYGPEDAPVINTLARNFAVCDRWFASVPSQTWPNRGFVHTGSSNGHVDNDHYEPYGNRTIFNVLSDQGKSWGVFHDTLYVPSLTHIQFGTLWHFQDNFRRFDAFKSLCADRTGDPARRLPAYSFVEPRFVPEPGPWWRLFRPYFPCDYHPPHDIVRGEQFLQQVYDAVRSSTYRDEILLVITFDEHGGCYDHLPPPWGSVAPEPGAVASKNGFRFDRFGVRVPTILVSSHVTPGTVFREAPGTTPFDHCSILATLRDWLHLDKGPGGFLPSPRIQSAPTIDAVLNRGASERLTDWPRIRARRRFFLRDTAKSTKLTGLQQGLLAHKRRLESANPLVLGDHLARVREELPTYAHVLRHLRTSPQRR